MKHTRHSHHLPNERGQAAIEFALIFPLCVVVLFIVVEATLLLRTWVVTEHASREGARYGAVGKSSDEILARTIERGGNLNLTSSNVTITNAKGTPGTAVAVKVTYSYKLSSLNKLAGAIWGGSFPDIPMGAQTQMRLE